MSFRNPNLSFHNAGNGSVSVCETVCICVCVCVCSISRNTCEEWGRCTLLSYVILQWKSPWILKGPIHTQTAENILWKIWGENEKSFWYARGSEVIIHTLHLFSLGWSRCLACSIHKPLATEYVCVLDALSRQNATEAYFRAWLYEGTGLSHAPGFSAPVNLAHFTQCRGDSQPPLCRETNRDRRIQPHHKKTLFPWFNN